MLHCGNLSATIFPEPVVSQVLLPMNRPLGDPLLPIRHSMQILRPSQRQNPLQSQSRCPVRSKGTTLVQRRSIPMKTSRSKHQKWR